MSLPEVESIHFRLPRPNHMREDEYLIDFKDDRRLAVKFWEDVADDSRHSLSDADYRAATLVDDFDSLERYVMTQFHSVSGTEYSRRISAIRPLPRTLLDFVSAFEKIVSPQKVDMTMLWSMVYYTIKLSTEASEKLKRTTNWLSRLRRTLALCYQCMEMCQDKNELRIALPDMLDPLMNMLDFAVKRLLSSNTSAEFAVNWPKIELKVKECLGDLDTTIKHLHEITSFSKVNQENEARFLSLRTQAHPDQNERAIFPVRMLKHGRNDNFFGRENELAAINAKLGNAEIRSLQTYTIYGRRGVGKTHLALEYAYRNLGKFDAIFWIQCETSASLRQSITDTAIALDLPGASQMGHFEENLVNTHSWLKKTRKRWLLVFDNAEDETLLRGYWPVGAPGSILITSRKRYNFVKDIDRDGNTVQPFDEEQSLQLLWKILGPDWRRTHIVEPFQETDDAAARRLMISIGGLALAIEQSAILIMSRMDKPDMHFRGFLKLFWETRNNLPPRPLGDRDAMIQSLDAIWSMAFNALSANARAFLGVLAFLAPDNIQVDLFLPSNQQRLQGPLEFCMSKPGALEQPRAALSNLIDPPERLQSVIDELSDAKLIIVDNRSFSIHRVIQEALHYQNFEELQDSFDAAVNLVYEAFPKQESGDPLHDVWTTCQEYVQHAIHIFARFKEYGPWNSRLSTNLEARRELILLGANCGWYLGEIADYGACLDMAKTAQAVCDDQETLTVAQLHNTAGSAYFEQNELKLCREGFERAITIREAKLGPDHRLVASSLANLANLETAEDNFEEARTLLQRAASIREQISQESMLGVTFMQIGRVDTLEGKFPDALKMFRKSEVVFSRQKGPRNFLADLYYAYGNREYLQSHYEEARRAYENCKKYAEQNRPLHPITGAAYYKLGSCEFELDNYEKARKFLYKALNIAEIQNPGADDGTVARILWKLSQVVREIPGATEDADAMLTRAIITRREITGRTSAEDTYDDGKEYEEMEHSFDVLVSGFFR